MEVSGRGDFFWACGPGGPGARAHRLGGPLTSRGACVAPGPFPAMSRQCRSGGRSPPVPALPGHCKECPGMPRAPIPPGKSGNVTAPSQETQVRSPALGKFKIPLRHQSISNYPQHTHTYPYIRPSADPGPRKDNPDRSWPDRTVWGPNTAPIPMV